MYTFSTLLTHSFIRSFHINTDFGVRKSSLPWFERETIHICSFMPSLLSVIFEQAVGYGIIAVTFALQPLMKWACGRLKGVWRIAVADVFLFLSFVGTANVWRGLWAILDHHFLPSKYRQFSVQIRFNLWTITFFHIITVPPITVFFIFQMSR